MALSPTLKHLLDRIATTVAPGVAGVASDVRSHLSQWFPLPHQFPYVRVAAVWQV
jgi:hypothetical protein